MKYFKEKIQNIKIIQNNNNQTPLAVAYDFEHLPQYMDIQVIAELFNVRVNKQYVLQFTFICSSNPTNLHLLNNVIFKPIIEDMIKVDDNYGLTYGSFTTTFPFDAYGEYEIKIDLLDFDLISSLNSDSESSVLDTYKTYLFVGEK